MLGTAGARLRLACSSTVAMQRARASLAAALVERCSVPLSPSFSSSVVVTRRALSSSMSASRPGAGADDSEDGASSGRQAGRGGGAMARQPLPTRTVPDDILGFSCRTYMAGDSEDRFPNVHGVHPAEFKVELMVHVPLLELSEAEEERLIQLVGPRYKERTEMLRLVSDRFPNRIDNKRYLVHLLENILVEARNVDEDE